VFGKISGLGLFLAGLVTLLQLAVNWIVLNYFGGDYLNTRIVLACLCVPFYLYPYFVWRQGAKQPTFLDETELKRTT
jgi:hypothetical protein